MRCIHPSWRAVAASSAGEVASRKCDVACWEALVASLRRGVASLRCDDAPSGWGIASQRRDVASQTCDVSSLRCEVSSTGCSIASLRGDDGCQTSGRSNSRWEGAIAGFNLAAHFRIGTASLIEKARLLIAIRLRAAYLDVRRSAACGAGGWLRNGIKLWACLLASWSMRMQTVRGNF